MDSLSARSSSGSPLAILALALALSAVTVDASAAPPTTRMSPERRENLATLRQQIRTFTTLEARTVDDVVRGLGMRIGPAIQVHEHRREWPIQPSAALEGGTIMEGGRELIVKLQLSRGLNATFEELASVLMDVPHFMDALEGHHGEDSLATRVLAIDHSFKVRGGHLTLRTANAFSSRYTQPDDQGAEGAGRPPAAAPPDQPLSKPSTSPRISHACGPIR